MTAHSEPIASRPGRLKPTVLVIMSVLILVPSMVGFIMKFMEFIHTFRDSADGAFAITPMLNYLLASMGFFSLLIWAAANGMFRDIEQPKYRMLEIDAKLNAERTISAITKPAAPLTRDVKPNVDSPAAP